MDPLHVWLNKFKADKTITHMNMLGGKYNIPYTEYQTFYELYAKCHESAFLVEKLMYPFKFFLDVDKCNVDETLLLVQKEFQEREYITLVNDQNDGVHVIFQDWIIQDEAQVEKAVSQLTMNVDRSVYKTGLRMVGSRKKLGVRRVYRPRTLRLKSESSTFGNPCVLTPEIMEMCSIHTPTSVPRTVSYTASDMVQKSIKRQHRDIVDFSWTKLEHMNSSFIKIHTLYKFCENIQREHKSNHVYYILDVKKKEMKQKCYCTCENKELSVNKVPCKNFESRPIKIPIKLYYKLTL